MQSSQWHSPEAVQLHHTHTVSKEMHQMIQPFAQECILGNVISPAQPGARNSWIAFRVLPWPSAVKLTQTCGELHLDRTAAGIFQALSSTWKLHQQLGNLQWCVPAAPQPREALSDCEPWWKHIIAGPAQTLLCPLHSSVGSEPLNDQHHIFFLSGS